LVKLVENTFDMFAQWKQVEDTIGDKSDMSRNYRLGATENAGVENAGVSKIQGWKSREWKSRHQNAGVEITGETSMESQNSRYLT